MKLHFKYTAALFLFGWLLLKGIVPAFSIIHSDFSNYYVSSRLIVEHRDLNKLYDNDWFQQQIKAHGIDEPGKFAPFPPITAWVMLPLTFTDAQTAKQIWTAINIALLFFCGWLISKITQWDLASSALLLLATGNGLINNFRFGQLYLFIVFGTLLSIYLFKSNKQKVGGFILAIVTWIKYFPVVFVLGLFIRRKHEAVIYTAASILLLLILQLWFFKASVMSQFFYSVFLPHLDSNLEGQVMYSRLFQSWDSLLRNAFIYSTKDNPFPILNWPSGIYLKWVVYSVFGIYLIYTWRRILKTPLTGQTKDNLVMSLPALAAFAILPVSASYHFVLLAIPMVFLLSEDLFTQKQKVFLAGIYFLIGIIPYGFFFKLADKLGLLVAYPRLALVTILFISATYLVNNKLSAIKA